MRNSDVYPRFEEQMVPIAASASVCRSRGFENTSEFEPVVDSGEAAKFLNINPKTLQKMARTGEVPAYRIGKLWKFRISDLDEWLRSRVISNCHSCRENERR